MITIDKIIGIYRVKGKVKNQIANGQIYKITDANHITLLLIAQWAMSAGEITIKRDYPDKEDIEEIIREALDSSIIPASDYNALVNKPKINNVTLKGNKTTDDLGLIDSEEVTIY